MSAETVFLFSGPNEWWARFGLEGMGIALCDHAKKFGGSGWAGWTDVGLKVRIQGAPADEIKKVLHAIFESMQKNARSMSVAEQQVEAMPLPNVAAGEIPHGTVIKQKLTKNLLKILPEDAFLVSASYGPDGAIFSERLGPKEKRDEIWRRAVLAGANNRICRLVWTAVDFNGPDSSLHHDGQRLRE